MHHKLQCHGQRTRCFLGGYLTQFYTKQIVELSLKLSDFLIITIVPSRNCRTQIRSFSNFNIISWCLTLTAVTLWQVYELSIISLIKILCEALRMKKTTRFNVLICCFMKLINKNELNLNIYDIWFNTYCNNNIGALKLVR